MTDRAFLLRAAAPLAALLALGLSACGEQTDSAVTEEIIVEDVAEVPAPAPADTAMPARSEAPAGASVSFGNLTDGQVVTSPLEVQFVATGIGVAPAGDQTVHTGHHHLLIDATVDSLDLDAPIPNDDNHKHFGMAQTDTTIELAPGTHTLQLVMGDWTHIPHEPVVASPVITVTVE